MAIGLPCLGCLSIRRSAMQAETPHVQILFIAGCHLTVLHHYRCTSLVRNCAPLESYSRPIPRSLSLKWRPNWGGNSPQLESGGVWPLIDAGLVGSTDFHSSGRGTTRAEDAQGTPTQSHISPSILVYEENRCLSQAEAGAREV